MRYTHKSSKAEAALSVVKRDNVKKSVTLVFTHDRNKVPNQPPYIFPLLRYSSNYFTLKNALNSSKVKGEAWFWFVANLKQ